MMDNPDSMTATKKALPFLALAVDHVALRVGERSAKRVPLSYDRLRSAKTQIYTYVIAASLFLCANPAIAVDVTAPKMSVCFQSDNLGNERFSRDNAKGGEQCNDFRRSNRQANGWLNVDFPAASNSILGGNQRGFVFNGPHERFEFFQVARITFGKLHNNVPTRNTSIGHEEANPVRRFLPQWWIESRFPNGEFVEMLIARFFSPSDGNIVFTKKISDKRAAHVEFLSQTIPRNPSTVESDNLFALLYRDWPFASHCHLPQFLAEGILLANSHIVNHSMLALRMEQDN